MIDDLELLLIYDVSGGERVLMGPAQPTSSRYGVFEVVFQRIIACAVKVHSLPLYLRGPSPNDEVNSP